MTRMARCVGTLMACLTLGMTIQTAGAAARARPHSSGPVVTSATTAPWAVRIFVTSDAGDFVCSGSIIDATHVLTAGHCDFNEDDGYAQFTPSDFEVTAGTVNVNSTASTQQSSAVSAVRVGPGYTPGTDYLTPDDIAELTLSTPLHFNAEVAPVAVATTAQTPAAGTADDIFSFGQVDQAGDYDGLEHSLPGTVQQPWSCGDNRPSTLCTVSGAGDNCPGDSGSGIIVDEPAPTLVGVLDYTTLTSANGGCTTDHATGSTAVTSPEIAAWLAGSASPPAAPTLGADDGPTLYPGTSQVGSTMTCDPPAFANATSVGFLFVTGAGTVLQSGPATLVVPAAALGQTIYCVAVGSGPGGSTYSAGGSTGAIAPQSAPGLHLQISRRGQVNVANGATVGLVMVVTATRRGSTTPAVTHTLPAEHSAAVGLGRLLPGVYSVCVTTASQGTYAPASVCRTWRHAGPALRFVVRRAVEVHHHPAVRLRATGPLRGARVHVAWIRGRHVIRRLTVRLRGTVTLRAPRGAHDLRLTVGARHGDGVKLGGGTVRIRLHR